MTNDTGFVLWLTGPSDAAARALASAVAAGLRSRGRRVDLLDPEEARGGSAPRSNGSAGWPAGWPGTAWPC